MYVKDRKLRPHQVPTPWHSEYGVGIVLIESRVPGSNPVRAIIFFYFLKFFRKVFCELRLRLVLALTLVLRFLR